MERAEEERWREKCRADVRFVNRGEEEEMEVWGFEPCWCLLCLVLLGALLSGGLLLLLLLWLPERSVRWTCRPAPLASASVLLLRTTDEWATWFRVRVRTLQAPGWDPLGGPCQCAEGPEHKSPHKHQTRFFRLQSVLYLWSPGVQGFTRLSGLDCGLSLRDVHTQHSTGLSRSTQQYRRLFYGANQIEVKVPSIPKLLVKEVLNPFYIFQVFSVLLWSLDDYYYYASAILFMSLLSVCTSLYTVRKQYVLLHDMVSAHNVVRCSVFRGTEEDTEEILSTDLVPGDVIVIPPNGMMMPCDAALVGGTCIVNESMLTGESVPVMKTQLPLPPRGQPDAAVSELLYDPEEHRRHTLFCGTEVIQTRYYSGERVRAVVVRTGFSTVKGRLVRSILFPRPSEFQLHRDAARFLLGLVGLATVGMAYSLTLSARQGESLGRMLVEALDIVTITVPPALPAAMTAGVVYAQQRLRGGGIFSTSPQRINTAGQVNLVCFDKTGTLTEDGLDLWGVRRIQDNRFCPPEHQVAAESLERSHFLVAMATCHSLTRIEGRLSGDPLDVKMFEATGWVLEEPSPEETALHDLMTPTVVRPAKQAPAETQASEERDLDIAAVMGCYEVGILAQFPFSSSLQRMSVVTRVLGERRLHAYLKGAPETVARLCRPESVPCDFWEVLENHTAGGLRVIALAHRCLEPRLSWHRLHSVNREVVECDMELLGLVMMQNQLKVQTVPVLSELHRAGIRCVMVTGHPPKFVSLCLFVSVSLSVSLSASLSLCVLCVSQCLSVSLSVSQCVSVCRCVSLCLCVSLFTPCVYFCLSVCVCPSLHAFNIRPTFAIAACIVPHLSVTGRCLCLCPSGDSMLTAVSVARESGLVPPQAQVIVAEAVPPRDGQPATVHWSYSQEGPTPDSQAGAEPSYHFALTGRSFCTLLEHFPDLLPKLLLCGTVFARMAPEQKTQLVEELQQVDYFVAMCGDGANDCGALKRAHVGVSLSQLEASVASPFTSRTPDISCVPRLIREGRAALVTSFCVFKFMALYSIIQYLCVLHLYSILSNMGDAQYLFVDVAIIMSAVFTMSLSPPWRELVPQRPPSSLLSPQLLLSVGGQILLALAFQTSAFLLAHTQASAANGTGACDSAHNSSSDWTPGWVRAPGHNASVPPLAEEEEEAESHNIRNLENSCLFFLSGCQYLSVALAYIKGRPFRQPVYTNYLFLGCVLSAYAFLLFNLLHPVPALLDVFQLVCIPVPLRLTLLALIAANLLLALTVESLIIDCNPLWRRLCSSQKQCLSPTDRAPMEMDRVPLPRGGRWRCFHSGGGGGAPHARYQRLAQELLLDPDWPPPPSASTKAGPPRSHSGALQGRAPQTTHL
ncbi:polyamine-transporting ATPase 13A3 isoform X2 [Amia ocellicauda]|uniref:polyamine-transporting ATPase 13A3 isoform X2 n=1 Tax=Amia ocellicauda TaxID=2972642 RepID=UPI00346404AB